MRSRFRVRVGGGVRRMPFIDIIGRAHYTIYQELGTVFFDANRRFMARAIRRVWPQARVLSLRQLKSKFRRFRPTIRAESRAASRRR